jgi:molybdenum cofactor cytidylyltransferase
VPSRHSLGQAARAIAAPAQRTASIHPSITSCQKRNAQFVRRMEKIGAIILAAGSSSRLGQPKQLLQFRGQTLLRRAVEAATTAGCRPVAVVVGAERVRVLPELAETKELLIENETWQRGIGNSIRTGLRATVSAYPEIEAIILLMCDQPLVDAETITALKAKHAETKKPIVASSYAGTVGIPALFSRAYFDELFVLDDEAGAKQIIMNHGNEVAEFQFPDGAIDIDTAADYEKLLAR